MPHFFNISAQIQREDHNGYLKNWEVARGETVKFIFSFENRGDEKFPGGYFEVLSTEYSGGAANVNVIAEKKFPPLEKGQTHEVNFAQLPASEGIAWVKIKLVSNDKQEIFYSDEGYEMPKSIGQTFPKYFYVVNRENISLIDELRKLNRLMKKPGSSI